MIPVAHQRTPHPVRGGKLLGGMSVIDQNDGSLIDHTANIRDPLFSSQINFQLLPLLQHNTVLVQRVNNPVC
ncbi:hypothetical protein D3C86_2164140 [compost metagenome]